MTASAGPGSLPVRRIEHCMGTVFSFDVRFPGVETTHLDDVMRWLHWVDETFSTYRADSQVSKLARGDIAEAACHPAVIEVLRSCERLHRMTDGYFDAHASGRLDPSGYVKGWAIEVASTMLTERGSLHHCVNGGGDVQTVGGIDQQTPWQVGIADPRNPTAIVAVVVGDNLAVATSGSVYRGDHVIDPTSPAPPSYWSSITMIGPTIAETDAFATAAYARGSHAVDWIEGLANYEACGVRADGTVWVSSGLTSPPDTVA